MGTAKKLLMTFKLACAQSPLVHKIAKQQLYWTELSPSSFFVHHHPLPTNHQSGGGEREGRCVSWGDDKPERQFVQSEDKSTLAAAAEELIYLPQWQQQPKKKRRRRRYSQYYYLNGFMFQPYSIYSPSRIYAHIAKLCCVPYMILLFLL